MILSLIALPLGIAFVVLFVRNLRPVPALLSAGAFAVLSASLLTQRETDAWMLLGRAMNLRPLESAVLGFGFALLALTILYTNWVPQGELAYPIVLSMAALFIAAVVFRNLALATLLLEGGIIVSAMLAPSERPGAAMSGIRALVLLALSGPMLLLAAWATGQYGARPDDLALSQIATIALALGFGIGLGVAPWHIWQPSLYQHGRVLAVVVLAAVLPAVLLLQLGGMVQASTWPGEESFVLGLLLAGGLLTTLAGSAMALMQRTVGRTVGFVALADLGLALMGLGLGTAEGTRAALLHLAMRGLGVTAAMMATGVLQQVLGGDKLDHLRGAFRRAPLAMLGLLAGGFSLAGLPLTAGFTTRLSLYTQLATAYPTWGVAVVVCSFGPIWSLARFWLAAWTSTPDTERHEPLQPGLIIALLGLVLLALGVWPNLLVAPLGGWLDAMVGVTLWR